MELVFRSCPLGPRVELFKNLRYAEGRGYIFLEDSALFARTHRRITDRTRTFSELEEWT